MQRLQASDFHPEVMRLFQHYQHGLIDRRAFLAGASRYTVGGVTASALLTALSPNYAAAQVVKPDDPRIVTRRVDIPSPQGNGTVRALLVRPANATGKLPGIVVVHENRGLNPHIEDIARRLALDNFVALAPDALTSVGGYPGTEEAAVAAFGKLDRPKVYQDFLAAAHWLKAAPECNGKYG